MSCRQNCLTVPSDTSVSKASPFVSISSVHKVSGTKVLVAFGFELFCR